MTAIRLTFNVVGRELTYRSAQRLNMRVPPQQKITNFGTGSGLWVELRDADGEPIYCRVLDAATLQADTEIRTGTSDRPVVRAPSDRVSSLFNVVIPDDLRGSTFHIFERRIGQQDQPPMEIFRLSIDELFEREN